MMIAQNRRNFLKGGSFVIGALAADSRAASASSAGANAAAEPQVAGFGWEISNLSDNGANVYVEVRNGIILQAIDVDASAMILSSGATGFAEVLCQAGVTQGRPSFTPNAAAYLNLRPSADFGPVTPDNPNGLDIGQSPLVQDLFFAVILKTWVPPDGSASATSRHVSASPGFTVNAGNYLMFHMDHCGVPVDAEMQVVIRYQFV